MNRLLQRGNYPMESSDRKNTLFNLSYAAVVLALYACLFQRLALALKFFSVLSGAGALVALSHSDARWTLALGLFFAVMQAIDLSLNPLERAAKALFQRRIYKSVIAMRAELDDVTLEREYQKAGLDDEVLVPYWIRCLAWNRTVEECALDDRTAYKVSPLLAALVS